MKEMKWAVLGTGVIANEMAQALNKNGRNIYAVANRTHEKAVDFAKKYNIAKVYDDMNDVFTDPEVDVIYITTPHNTHIEFMKKAIENGKHIVTANKELLAKKGEELFNLAEKHNRVVLYEAAIAGGIPIIMPIKTILAGNKINKIQAILNGTTNYILTKMAVDGASSEDVL